MFARTARILHVSIHVTSGPSLRPAALPRTPGTPPDSTGKDQPSRTLGTTRSPFPASRFPHIDFCGFCIGAKLGSARNISSHSSFFCHRMYALQEPSQQRLVWHLRVHCDSTHRTPPLPGAGTQGPPPPPRSMADAKGWEKFMQPLRDLADLWSVDIEKDLTHGPLPVGTYGPEEVRGVRATSQQEPPSSSFSLVSLRLHGSTSSPPSVARGSTPPPPNRAPRWPHVWSGLATSVPRGAPPRGDRHRGAAH